MTAARPPLRIPIIVAAVSAIVVANLGGLLTDLGVWYQNLEKPSWQPPDWLFPPAWTVIFVLTAASAVLAWRAAPDTAGRAWIIGSFAVNGVLNVLWSGLFFALRRPDWALAAAMALWLSIVVLIVVTGRFSRTSAWLLSPYLAWVSFAIALNYAVVQLNGPFGGA